ncbi:MAG: hypothetical protein MJA82_14605 [Clostridia bacterium]|nr:hypothetical protein [Clostridia bacterium]
MSAPGERVVFKKGNIEELPPWAEANVLLFCEDIGRLFKGNGYNQPLTEFTNVLSNYLDLADLKAKNPAIRGKIYITNDNRLYTFDGYDYVAVGGGSGGGSTLEHNKLLNRSMANAHPMSAITGLTRELTNLSTKIEDIRFRGIYPDYGSLPTSVSMNRNGDIAVTIDPENNYGLYVWNSRDYTWEQLSMGDTQNISVYEKTTNPQVTEDIDKGYLVGDIWINSTTKAGYVCSDNKTGHAVWKLITLDNLSSFTTDDLRETTSNQFVSNADKNNLLQLQSIIDSQNNIKNQLNSMDSKIPNDASSSNKLVSTDTMENTIANIKFEDLHNVPSSLIKDSFLAVDEWGSGIIFKRDIDINRYIDKITDKDGTEFNHVHGLKFANLIGTTQQDRELLLTAKIFSTDILDMPTSFHTDKILVSNADSLSYKLKSIDELALLSENFNINVTEDDPGWIDSTSTTSGKYEYIIHHSLDSLNIIAMFYDINDIKKDIEYKILSKDEIVVLWEAPISFRAVINCSQGTSSEHLNEVTKPPITASDFIDDIHVREDKTYSSKKIEDIVKDFISKDNVYTKVQSDSIYASKSYEHSHRNLSLLNNLEADQEGDLTYRGKKLMTKVEAFHYEDHWSNTSYPNLKQLIDMRNIYNTMGYTTIVNSEITIKNLYPSVDEETDRDNTLNLIVMDNGIKVLDVEILPQDVQKYLLGISPNLTVFVKGTFDANFYVGAF